MLSLLKKSLVFSIFCLYFSCSQQEPLSDTELLSYKLDRDLNNIAKTKYNLEALGNGGSIDHGKITTISTYLSYDDALDIHQCRTLMVNVTNDFSNIINRTTEYYDNVDDPLNPLKLLEISISISDNGNYSHLKGPAIMYNGRGVISYTLNDPKDPAGPKKITIHRETFEEAEQILAQENNYADAL